MPMPDLSLEISHQPGPAWVELYRKVRRFPLLQDPGYLTAFHILEGLKPGYGVICDAGIPAGIFAFQEKRALAGLLHVVILDRGPVWEEGRGSAEDWAAFFKAFNRLFPPRWGRARRLIPETEDETIPVKAGLSRRRELKAYGTAWVDLTVPQAGLRKNLAGKWRNRLAFAEKKNLTLHWDDLGRGLPDFLSAYEADRLARGYGGPPADMVLTMAAAFGPKKKLLFGTARDADGAIHARCLFFLHGTSATYQVGLVSDAGRASSSNHLLLFGALNALAEKGIMDCDLGGINETDAAGLTAFKTGMGGRSVRLAGAYR